MDKQLELTPAQKNALRTEFEAKKMEFQNQQTEYRKLLELTENWKGKVVIREIPRRLSSVMTWDIHFEYVTIHAIFNSVHDDDPDKFTYNLDVEAHRLSTDDEMNDLRHQLSIGYDLVVHLNKGWLPNPAEKKKEG